MNVRISVRRQLFTELSKIESDFGAVLYVRVDHNPTHPGMLLADQTLYVAPGGTVDVLASPMSAMGLERVGYTPGLKAQRKVRKGLITYRFQVPEDTMGGKIFEVQCLGETDQAGFKFFIRVT